MAEQPNGGSDRRSPAELHTSKSGKRFISIREADNTNATAHTHWPGGNSGVTIGPGYDFAFHTQEQIVFALMSVGVDETRARVLATAGKPRHAPSHPGLLGQAAKEFAEQHAGDVTLSPAKQRELLDYILPEYGAAVRSKVRVPVTQNQFDALVSFAYSRGRKSLGKVVEELNNGDYEGTATALQHFDDSRSGGFQSRRIAEAAVFRSTIVDHRE